MGKCKFSLAAYAALMLSVLSVCLSGIAAAGQKQPSPPPAPAPGDLNKLAEGVFARVVSPDSDAVSNAGVVVLDSGVLLFDTHFTPEAADALQEKLKAVTSKPVRYIVNSHFHSDHTHGNQAVAGVRQIIGSSNTRRDMLQKDLATLNQMQTMAQSQVEQLSKDIRQEQDVKAQEALRIQLNQRTAFMRRMASLKILAPWMAIDDNLSILDGGREVDLLCLGPGHTDGDVVLYLPEEKVAFLGDLFFHEALPNVEDAHILDWIKTLREAVKLDANSFVPGHGQVGSKSDVEDFITYFEDLKALVEPGVTRGDTLEQVIRDLRLPAKYVSYSFQNFFPANVQKMYTELKAALPVSQQQGVKKQGFHP
jgi:glyoxylase-like metal-dependent hydrolase (beta-lactamase superfamily II)